MNWRPSATLTALQQRVALLKKIRDFFAERNVLEVETPQLSYATVTAPYVKSLSPIRYRGKNYYLQTSPEYPMKRLLAAGYGAIFQISKTFRDDDAGRVHHPEFTLLEWYRPGFDHHQLMNEMDELLQLILKTSKAERMTYQHLFEKYLQINPHTATLTELQQCAQQYSIHFTGELDRDAWLHLLLTHEIEPQIAQEKPLFLYDFPVSQAALAKIRYEENPPVASRFEVYFKGIELANGFHELQNAAEQRQRFQHELIERKALQLPDVPIDEHFLSALEHGLPDCAGVALGIDRLIMLACGYTSIAEVVSFVE